MQGFYLSDYFFHKLLLKIFAFGGEMFGKAGVYVSDKLCA